MRVVWLEFDWVTLERLLITFYSHANFTPSVFLGSNLTISHILASVPACFTHSLLHAFTLVLNYTHPHTHKMFLIPGWSEYPMVHCNGTSRWSLIGLDHWTSLGDGCQRLVVVSLWGGCAVETHFRVSAFLPHMRESFCAGKVRLKGNKGNWVNQFSNTLLTSAFI